MFVAIVTKSTTSLSNNLSLTLVELSVQNVVLNAALRKNTKYAQVVDGNGTNSTG